VNDAFAGSGYPSYQPYVREQTGPNYDDQLCSILQARMKASEQATWAERRENPSLFNTYQGNINAPKHPHKHTMSLNQIFAAVEGDVARKTRALLLGDTLRFEGQQNPGGATAGRKQTALFNAQVDEDGAVIKGYQFLKMAAIYGTAVAELGWKHVSREAMRYLSIPLPGDGKVIRLAQQERVTDFDGPTFEPFDIDDFFEEPGKARIADMRGAGRRLWRDLDEIEMLASDGVSMFRKDAVAKLKKIGSLPGDMADDVRQMRGSDALNGRQWPFSLPYTKPVMLFDYVGWIPPELTPDGIAFRRITTANHQVVLRNVPFPMNHGRLDRTFVSYSPFMSPHYFRAVGKVKIAKKMQEYSEEFINQALDGLALGIDPCLFVDEAAQWDPRGMFMKPGRVWTISGPPGERVQPVQFNLQGLPLALQFSEMLSKWLQQGTGLIEDVAQGIGGNRQTAREFLGRAEGASNRLDCEVLLCEVTTIEPWGDAWMENNRQFLTSEREVSLLGEDAFIDPVTGERVDTMMVGPMDVQPKLRCKARGSSQRLSRAMQQQNAILMTQTAFGLAQGQPAVLAKFNVLGWIKWLARLHEVGSDVNELVNQDPAVYQQELMTMLAASQAARPQQSPEQAFMGGGGEGGVQNGMPNQVQETDGSDVGELVGSLSGGFQN
jgi:hypothetical protein